jgi:hypothetical protein
MESLPLVLRTLWCGAMVWSLVSLAVFRSSAGHGPDAVGQEVAGFVGPLLLALVLGGVMFYLDREPSAALLRWGNAMWATLLVGTVEMLLYCAVVVR